MIPMDGAADLPKKQKEQLLESIELMQARDSLRMYNTIVEKCFRECVEEFRRRELDVAEEKCIAKCGEKFIKNSQRVGIRFAELSAELEEQIQQQISPTK